MQKIILVSIVVLTAVSFLLLDRGDEETLQISTNVELATLYIKDIPLSVEIADTPSTRQLGLSGKPFLEAKEGMLFVFNTDSLYGFWMKDMLFDIDIIWINSNLKVVDVKESATPESFPKVFKPAEKSRYVLEVNRGFVKENSIKIGDSVRFDTLP